MGSKVIFFSKIDCFGRCATFRKACFLPLYYTGNRIAAEEDKFTKQIGGEVVRSMGGPARPLNSSRKLQSVIQDRLHD